MAARNYPTTIGTCELIKEYPINCERDDVLSNLINPATGLKYTYQSAKDMFPAMLGYCELKGWSQQEVLGMYEFDMSWNDRVWANNTYMGVWGYYQQPNFITQSRAHIIAPDGRFRQKYGGILGLGRYSGMHPNQYADTRSTPGTALVVDHANWMSNRNPDRNNLFSASWGADYSVVGGSSYAEGVQVERFRFLGGRDGQPRDPSFKSWGVALGDPGENSGVFHCMATGFNSSGYAQMGGTPAQFNTSSAFYNCEFGVQLLGTSALHNTTLYIPSGDNNKLALVGMEAFPGQVCGGTVTMIAPKSESRAENQRLLMVRGKAGLLGVTIIGATADYSQGALCPELVYIEDGDQWQVEFINAVHSSNLQSLLYHAKTGKRYGGEAPFRHFSVCINDEGPYNSTRSSIVLMGSTPPATVPTIDFFLTEPPTLQAPGQVMLKWETTNATKVTMNGTDAIVDGSTPVTVNATTTFTLVASGPGGNTTQARTVTVGSTPPVTGLTMTTALVPATDFSGAHPASYATDANPGSYFLSNRDMRVGDELIFDFPSKSSKGIEISLPTGLYNNSYPRKFDLYVWVNGGWEKKGGTFTGAAVSTANIAAVTTGRMRVVIKEANANWLAIGNVKIL